MSASKKNQNRIYDARPDTLDFRDKMYQASLYEVPSHIDLDEYKQWQVPILDQGQEGACTGFGLATVANYLLRRRKVVPDSNLLVPACCTKWQNDTMNGKVKIIVDRAPGVL